MTEVKCIDGVKDYAGVSQGQLGVKLLRNALGAQSLIGKTLDQSIIHWFQGHAGVMQGSATVKLLKNAIRFVRKNL